MEPAERVASAWNTAAGMLPDGWTLDSLRCASTSLAPADRSDDWIAQATGPTGHIREFRAPEPDQALLGLAEKVRATA